MYQCSVQTLDANYCLLAKEKIGGAPMHRQLFSKAKESEYHDACLQIYTVVFRTDPIPIFLSSYPLRAVTIDKIKMDPENGGTLR